MDIIIRHVNPCDLNAVADIENQCFPPEEAAGRESLQRRISTFPENFLVAEYDGALVGFINGCTTDSPVIFDEMFYSTDHHMPSAPNIAVFGLDVVPGFRNRGIAAELMGRFIENARRAGKKKVILTCKEHLVHYYERLGFVNNGVSGSTHGGASWYDMTCFL